MRIPKRTALTASAPLIGVSGRFHLRLLRLDEGVYFGAFAEGCDPTDC